MIRGPDGIDNAAGKLVNFFDHDDKALSAVVWQNNQNLKPNDTFRSYPYWKYNAEAVHKVTQERTGDVLVITTLIEKAARKLFLALVRFAFHLAFLLSTLTADIPFGIAVIPNLHCRVISDV